MADIGDHEEFSGNGRREEFSRIHTDTDEKKKRHHAIRTGEVSLESIVHILNLRTERVNDVLARAWPDDIKKQFLKKVVPLLEESIEEMKIALEKYEPL